MVEHKGELSNQLFCVLEEWERNLKGCFKESSASASLPEPPTESTPDTYIWVHTR